MTCLNESLTHAGCLENLLCAMSPPFTSVGGPRTTKRKTSPSQQDTQIIYTAAASLLTRALDLIVPIHHSCHPIAPHLPRVCLNPRALLVLLVVVHFGVPEEGLWQPTMSACAKLHRPLKGRFREQFPCPLHDHFELDSSRSAFNRVRSSPKDCISTTPTKLLAKTKATYLVAVSPEEVLGPNVLVRVLNTFLERGLVRPVLPMLCPQTVGVDAAEDNGGDHNVDGEFAPGAWVE